MYLKCKYIVSRNPAVIVVPTYRRELQRIKKGLIAKTIAVANPSDLSYQRLTRRYVRTIEIEPETAGIR
jgi:hypothetical protein